MKWEEFRWPHVQAMSKDMPVVISLGSVEQHGLHLPVCTDTCQVTAIAERVETELHDQIVMLPTLWLGSSHHHLDFPGTLSLRPSLYTQVVQDLVTSVLKAGFRRIFLLNGHGGNEVPIAQALSELSCLEPLAKQAILTFASWWRVGRPDPQQHGMTTPGVSHACEYETSLMLYLRGDLVEQAKAQEADPALSSRWLEGPNQVQEFRCFSMMTASGSLGKPSAATAEKGESMLQTVVDDVVAFLREFSDWPLPQQLAPPPVE